MSGNQGVMDWKRFVTGQQENSAVSSSCCILLTDLLFFSGNMHHWEYSDSMLHIHIPGCYRRVKSQFGLNTNIAYNSDQLQLKHVKISRPLAELQLQQQLLAQSHRGKNFEIKWIQLLCSFEYDKYLVYSSLEVKLHFTIFGAQISYWTIHIENIVKYNTWKANELFGSPQHCLSPVC